MKKEKELMKCPNCNYEWDSKSLMDYVTCPKCMRKFPVNDDKNDKDEDE